MFVTERVIPHVVFSAKYPAALTASKRPIMKVVWFLFVQPSGMFTIALHDLFCYSH